MIPNGFRLATNRLKPGLVAVLGALFLTGSPASGQVAAVGQILQPPGYSQSGLAFPRIPPRGDWLEVVTVTPKWLVLQNERGQQFPASFEAIELFVMRWPTSLDQISPTALLEVTGIELSATQIRADHMDIFEGPARGLVTPTIEELVGFNRVVTPFDVQSMNIYGQTIPLLPGEEQIPNRLHVVGPLVGTNPIAIAAGGNNAVAVYPYVGGIFMTQVTPGSASFVRPGDLVYVVVPDATTKSLMLSQLVVYKSMSLRQFTP
jgi:hypothetical protein